MLRETRAAGICTMVLGIILTTYSGHRIGRRIDWAANYVYGVYSTPYKYVLGETEQLQSRNEEEMNYVLNSLYIGAAGLASLLFGGICTTVSRERISSPAKQTNYNSLSPRKGSKENPYRL